MIQTERLFIRELTEDDWRGMQSIASDFRASQYAVYDRPLPVEKDAIRELTVRFAESRLFFAVRRREDGEMIGYICFHENGGRMDLGYCFHSRYQGRGYACESCAALMAEMERRGVKGFTAGTALANTPSCRLLEKLGFKLISTERVKMNGDYEFAGGVFVK